LRCVGTKVVVVGGGSTYTPELVDSLCAHEDRLVVDELVLLDPDAERLEVVAGLSDRILVMYEGNVTLETRPDQTNESELGLAMTGGTLSAEPA